MGNLLLELRVYISDIIGGQNYIDSVEFHVVGKKIAA